MASIQVKNHLCRVLDLPLLAPEKELKMAPLSGSSNLTGRPTINEGFISSIEHPRGDCMQWGGVRNKHGQLGVEPTLAAGRGPFA